MKKTAKKTSRRTGVSRRRSARPRPPAESALLAFAAFAEREHLRWYLFGAQAVAVYGVQRTTADIDITIELTGRTFEDIQPALARAGFAPRFADAAFAIATHVFPIVHEASAMPLDLVVAGPGLEQVFLDAVQVHSVARRSIPVLSPEHLVVTKVLAQRPKDLEDVRGLVRAAKIDHAVVDELLAQLEEALGQSDLRPLYARLRRETR